MKKYNFCVSNAEENATVNAFLQRLEQEAEAVFDHVYYLKSGEKVFVDVAYAVPTTGYDTDEEEGNI